MMQHFLRRTLWQGLDVPTCSGEASGIYFHYKVLKLLGVYVRVVDPYCELERSCQ